MNNYALEIDFEKIIGYKKLSFPAKAHFEKMYKKHNAIFGIDYKKNWIPTKVAEHKDSLKVYFANGEWARYFANGTWG